MKILMINDYVEYGGAEVYIKDLTQQLRKRTHKVFHFFIDEKINKNNNKLIYYLNHNYFSFKLYKKLREYIQKIKPDIIHLHNNHLYTNSILMACKNYKIVQTVHDYGMICPISWAVKKRNYSLCNCKQGLKCGLYCLPFSRNILSFCIPDIIRKKIIKKNIDLFISPSIKLKEFLEESRLNNVTYLPYFKAISCLRPKKSKKKNIVLFVGALQEHKGVKYLIKAMSKVIRKVRDVKLVIVGDGPEKTKLIDYSKKLRINEYINFVGGISHDRISKYYEDAFVVAIPSIWMENSPLVAYETMNYGKSIIASNIGGLPDLIKDGKNGFLVERFDTNMIAKRIIQLFNNKKFARQMGENGRRMLEDNFNEKEHMKKLILIYKSIK
jgi:glycosyltransferase involved in cell wall biosynthesis